MLSYTEELWQEGMQQGMQKGRLKAFEEVAMNLLRDGDSPERISRLTKVSPERIQELATQLATIQKNPPSR